MTAQATALYKTIKSIVDFAPGGYLEDQEVSIIAFEWVRAAKAPFSFNDVGRSAVDTYVANKLLVAGFGEATVAAVAQVVYDAFVAINKANSKAAVAA